MYHRLLNVKIQDVYESDFKEAITETLDGRVYYFDHVLPGLFIKGKFHMDREVFNFIKGNSFYL